MNDIKLKREDVEDLTLLLAYLQSWKEPSLDENGEKVDMHVTWIGYNFDILDRLTEKELIDSKRGRKLLYLTKKGVEKAKKVARKYHI